MKARKLLIFLAWSVSALTWSAVPATAAENSAKNEKLVGQKIVCRKLAETDSLVRKKKVCLTRQQWSRAEQNGAKYAQQLADELRSRPISR